MKKLYYLLFILLYRIACVTAGEEESVDRRTLGVRVLFNHGIADKSCSDEEHSTVRHLLLDSAAAQRIQTQHHNLRNTLATDLPLCENVCNDHATGTCYLVAPCSTHIPTDDEKGLEIRNVLPAGDELQEQCEEMKDEVTALVTADLIKISEVSPTCRRFLGKRAALECFRIV